MRARCAEHQFAEDHLDCEKYDKISLDLLYDELDELTAAAALRHVAQCQRCRSIHAELRATRSVGVLPLVDPPAGFEQRIVAAERRERAHLPLNQRMGRAISVLAGYAMRPQLAMAAILVLMIGASLFLWSGNPTTEQVVARSDDTAQRLENAPAAAAPAPQPAPTAATGTLDEGMKQYHAGNYPAAEKTLNHVAAQGGPQAGQAALYAAQSVRNQSGCKDALPRFEEVAKSYPDEEAGSDARFRAANCRRKLGDAEAALADYRALQKDAQFGDRAKAAIRELTEPVAAAPKAVASKVAARKKAKPATKTRATATSLDQVMAKEQAAPAKPAQKPESEPDPKAIEIPDSKLGN